MTRRKIVAAAVVTAASYSRIMGANNRMLIGLIGCGARGHKELQPAFEKLNGPLTGVCDLWRKRAEEAAANSSAKVFDDHRRLLELPGLDAVIVATSDHWHAPIAVDALNAGKDVYVEKPLTLRMEEGPRIVQAARVNRRICQVGSDRGRLADIRRRSATYRLGARRANPRQE
jgi:predicted dehydrogenase